jgi:hypothetical protein
LNNYCATKTSIFTKITNIWTRTIVTVGVTVFVGVTTINIRKSSSVKIGITNSISWCYSRCGVGVPVVGVTVGVILGVGGVLVGVCWSICWSILGVGLGKKS